VTKPSQVGKPASGRNGAIQLCLLLAQSGQQQGTLQCLLLTQSGHRALLQRLVRRCCHRSPPKGSKIHASTWTTSAQAAHSRIDRDLPHCGVAYASQSKVDERLETRNERIVDGARSVGVNEVLKVRADLEPGSDLKKVAGLELSLEISRVIF
jgi:hypothetical protein